MEFAITACKKLMTPTSGRFPGRSLFVIEGLAANNKKRVSGND